MSTYLSLRTKGGPQARARAHPGQIKGSARKRRRQEEKAAAEIAEANALGIPVHELRFKKYREDKTAIAEHKRKMYMYTPAPIERRRGYWDD